MSSLKALRAIAILVAAMFVVSACAQAPAPSGGGSRAPSGAPQAAVKRGGTVSIAFSVDPNHFDPHRGTTAQNFVSVLYVGLTQFKTGPDVPPGTHIIQPALAEKWEISPDGKTYTFSLRKGVK